MYDFPTQNLYGLQRQNIKYPVQPTFRLHRAANKTGILEMMTSDPIAPGRHTQRCLCAKRWGYGDLSASAAA